MIQVGIWLEAPDIGGVVLDAVDDIDDDPISLNFKFIDQYKAILNDIR